MAALIVIANVLLATLPGLFWFWWYARQDRKRPEPKGYLWRVFLLGALVTIPALFIEFSLDLIIPFADQSLGFTAIAGTLLVVAPVEELSKFLMVRIGVYKNKAFDERLDGIIYMVVAALGFATVENVLVVLREGSGVLPLRFLTATLLHVLASGIIGFFMGQAKFMRSRARAFWMQLLGLIIGISLHGLYDFLVINNSNARLSLIFIFMLVFYVVLDLSVRYLRKLDGSRLFK